MMNLPARSVGMVFWSPLVHIHYLHWAIGRREPSELSLVLCVVPFRVESVCCVSVGLLSCVNFMSVWCSYDEETILHVCLGPSRRFARLFEIVYQKELWYLAMQSKIIPGADIRRDLRRNVIFAPGSLRVSRWRVQSSKRHRWRRICTIWMEPIVPTAGTLLIKGFTYINALVSSERTWWNENVQQILYWRSQNCDHN